jgi:ribosomal protein S18 acetylase RimI-like enzyme
VGAIRDIQLRTAAPEDAGAIVALARASFEPAFLELTILACDGVERYVRALIEADGRGVDTTYAVAIDEGRLVGFAEMRHFSDCLFLNYIAVASHARSRGLGTRLLGAAIARSRRPGQQRLDLDVLEDNRPAFAWYRSLGLREGPMTDWWALPLPAAGGEPAVPISGWAQATACHRAFGFSEIGVEASHRSYRVGLLGKSWFRVRDVAALDDPAFGAALRALDPTRSLLALVPRGEMPERTMSRAERRATMIRLSAGLDGITRELREHAP